MRRLRTAARRALFLGSRPTIRVSPGQIGLVLLCILTLSVVGEGRWFWRHVPGYQYHQGCNPAAIPEKDVPNFHKVDDDLYRGAPPACAGYADLARAGIRTIIYLQGGSGKALKSCQKETGVKLDFVSYNLPLVDTVVAGISDENLAHLFFTLQQAPKPIFVTCKFGEDRTGVVVALYRMKLGEMPFAEAEQEALYYGMEPHLLPGITRTLDRFKDPQKLSLIPSPTLSPTPPGGVCKLPATGEAAGR